MVQFVCCKLNSRLPPLFLFFDAIIYCRLGSACLREFTSDEASSYLRYVRIFIHLFLTIKHN